MTSMVERVARAIYEASADRTGWPWDRSALGGKEHWKRIACAAIAEMREPTSAMTRASYNEFRDENEVSEWGWRARIDAALIPNTLGDVQGISQGRGE